MASKSWDKFLNEIEDAKGQLTFQKNEECFFRGHTKSDYNLLPSLFRNLEKGYSEEQLWDIEAYLFYEFNARAKDVHGACLNDWDVLFYMQHHLVNTRLLDWTESLGAAIYFSLLNYQKGKSPPCIWLLNPYKLNERFHESRDMYSPEMIDYYAGKPDEMEGDGPEDEDMKGDGLDNENSDEEITYGDYFLYATATDIIWWKQPIAVYPVRRVDRLISQGGYFTIHGTDTRPIEKIIKPGENIYAKVRLPDEAIPSALKFLEYARINDFTMFPDLDGLARYLNKKHF